MHQQTIQAIVDEFRPLLAGRFLGKVFQLSPLTFALDFGLRHGRYLFLSVEPATPRLHLVERRVKDLEKQSTSLSQYALTMQARLGHARLTNIDRDPSERVVRFAFLAEDDLGATEKVWLVAQLTGRSANLFLLDERDCVTHVLRPPRGEGQLVGDVYQPPPGRAGVTAQEEALDQTAFESVSAAVVDHYRRQAAEQTFASRAASLRSRLGREIAQKVKLKDNLEQDLAVRGDPEQHKRLGELLLANIATAKRAGQRVMITDYYAEGTPTLELEIDENTPLSEEATRYFQLYSKAKRAAEEIASRLIDLERRMIELRNRQANLEEIVAARDEAALNEFDRTSATSRPTLSKKERAAKIPGARCYRSSDGYEILVGRRDRDNDHLTFRVAKPNDLWLHAADYPGSHVVVRNPNRTEIAQRTIIEAAQLAGRFSQAGKDSKVVVHYTPRKFLSKPKGSAPGLVRLSRFKSITIEPKEGIERC